jgi:hypothetical protein
MSLDQDASFFLIDLTQLFPGSDGFADTVGEREGELDAGAVAAHSAKVGQAVADRVLQAGHGLRQHDAKGIFARAARSGEDERGRHAFRRNCLAQMADCGHIPRKLIEAHIMRLAKRRPRANSCRKARPEGS